MLTGLQIRTARNLLRWAPHKLAERARLPTKTIERAESTEGEACITIAQENEIRRVLRAAGIEFIAENGGGAGVRMREPGEKA
jgi:hypothetical protein